VKVKNKMATTPSRVARRTAANAARQSADSANVVTPEITESQDITLPEPPSADLSARRADGKSVFHKVTPLAMNVEQEDLTRRIDQSDLVMPKLRISQAMSAVNKQFSESRGKSGVAMGSWYNTSSSTDLGRTVYFIPIDMRKSRGRFVQGQGLVCRSFDLRQGVGTPGIPCEGTFEEIHQFPENERGCGISYNFPGVLIENIEDPAKTKMTTVMLSLRGASSTAAKQINTLVMNGSGVWHSVIVELGVADKNGPAGNYYIPTVDLFDLTSAPEYDRVARYAENAATSLNPNAVRATLESTGDDE
jgi:hypothetical protein